MHLNAPGYTRALTVTHAHHPSPSFARSEYADVSSLPLMNAVGSNSSAI